MIQKKSQYEPKTLVEQLKSDISSISDIFYVMIGEKAKFDLNLFIDLCNKDKVTIFGGIFPAVFTEDDFSSENINFVKMKSSTPTQVVRYLEFSDYSEYNVNEKSEDKKTLLVLLDGLTSGINRFLGELYKSFGDTVNYIGGGAGYLSLEQKPCVFNNEGLFSDAAVICSIDTKVMLGVKHGLKSIAGPFIATKASDKTIQQLNWESPIKLYSEIIKEDSGQTINKNNLFELSNLYPFGITKETGGFVVRDPISFEDNGEILCIGEINENEAVDILKGDNNLLLQAAQEAAEDANVYDKEIKCNMMFNCISRSLFLKANFSSEISRVKNTLNKSGNTRPIHGVLSLGEISTINNSFLDFLNMTILLGVFYE